jgi:MFS transporter, ACS family, D-galactonate transporter
MISTRKAWVIVALLFLFLLINWADKVVLGLAAVPIMRDLGLTPKQFGFVASSFFFLFSTSAVVIGFVANHVPTRWVLLCMAAIWSIMQFPMLGSASLGTLVACRIVLGAGEGPAYPVAVHAAHKWLPNEQRTLPTSVIPLGGALGVIVALPALDWVIERYGWHWAFGVLGILGLIWCLAWLAIGAEGPLEGKRGGTGATTRPYSRLLLNPTTLAGFAAGFGAYCGVSLLVTWLVPYLVKGLGFSQYSASWISDIPWAMAAITGPLMSWISERMLARGFASRSARGVLAGGSVAFGGVALLALPFLPGAALKIAAISIGIAFPSVMYVVGHVILAEYTPEAQRGAMLSINNAVWTSAGVIAPYLMGSVVQDAANAAEGYSYGFVLCGMVELVGGVIGMIWLNPRRELLRLASDGTMEILHAPATP